jgi:hypothetical protein
MRDRMPLAAEIEIPSMPREGAFAPPKIFSR